MTVNQRSVWMVETGEYENRGVDSVFAAEDLANAHAARINGQVTDGY